MIALAAILAVGCGRLGAQPASYPYRPATYDALTGVSQNLKIFPLDGEAFKIRLPFELGRLAYSPDGRALYASYLYDLKERLIEHKPGRPGIFKIEFNPIRLSHISGSDDVGGAGLAIPAGHEDVLITGEGLGASCAIFAIHVATGVARTVVQAPDCVPGTPVSEWQQLSVSPDERRATARRNQHLNLIDLSSGSIAAMPPDYTGGAWSPDRKWLAIMKKGGNVVLLDTSTLQERRELGAAMLEWSPDSRYLLAQKRNCGFSEIGSLEIVDVETGNRTYVASSHCQIQRGAGWVSGSIRP